MNLLELGVALKTERERRKLSLRDVMESTKISRRNLNALEAGEIKSLPHPVYLKGYVRNYARLMGLDAEGLVAVVEQQSDGDSGYIAQVASVAPAPAAPLPAAGTAPGALDRPAEPGPVESGPVESGPGGLSAPETNAQPAGPELPAAPLPPAEEPQGVPTPEPEAVPSQIRFPAGQDLSPKPRKPLWPWVLLLVFSLCLALLYVQYTRIQAEVEQAAPPVVAAPAPVENATVDNATQNATEANVTEAAAPAVEPAVPAPTVAAPPVQTPSAPVASPATPSVPATAIEVSRKAPAAPTVPSPEVRTPGMQSLTFTAKPREICWVGVYEGQKATTFLLRDGESRQVEFAKGARVRLGNAGGVSVRLNGQDYPFEGDRGQKVTLEIGTR